MLIKCPECELNLSDKAISCPHCGYPMKKQIIRTSTRRKRLPNGFGQITKIKGNLREPYRAMITVGKNEYGRPICQILKPKGYFSTYNEAYEALVANSKNPYELTKEMTCGQLFDKIHADYLEMDSKNMANQMKAAWNYCSSVHNLRLIELRIRHVKNCIENGEYNGKTPSPAVGKMIKTVFNKILKLGMEYEIIDNMNATSFDYDFDRLEKHDTHVHTALNSKEISLLWQKEKYMYVAKMALIQCYTGMRPNEICMIKTEDVNINDWYLVGGSKTAAGRNRIVPIHAAIRPILKPIYDTAIVNGYEYLFTQSSGKEVYYRLYHKEFINILPDKYPHDCRKWFITTAKKYKLNDYAIKRIVGHAITDVTESIYTERGIEWLHEEISKIPCIECLIHTV